MIRVVRTRTLRELREALAEADETANTYEAEADRWNGLYVEECDRADAEAERADRLLAERDALHAGAEAANDSAIRAEVEVEALRRQLTEALDAAEVQFAGLHAVIRQVSAERDAARAEARAFREQLGTAPRHQDQDARAAAAESAGAVLAARTSKETDQ